MGPVIARGTDYLLWALLDHVVDQYYPVFDRIEDALDDLEDRIVSLPDRDTLEQLFSLKRQLVELRHVSSPQREVFNQLTNRTLPFIDPEHVVYFRDIYDHAVHLSDEYDSFRELASGGPRRLPLDDQQQPVADHEAADRASRSSWPGSAAFAGIFGMSEAGAAFARQRGGRLLDRHDRDRRSLAVALPGHPAPHPLDLSGGYWQATGFAVGFAAFGSAGPTLMGRAMIMVFPIVPRGPSDVWSISCSSVASKAMSRLLWLRSTRVIS